MHPPLIILSFLLLLLLTLTATDAAADPNDISINCGGPPMPATALSGRTWGGDAAPLGSSTASTVKGELIPAVDPIPYSSARISRSQFSFSFHLTPGQKFIRLHFNPVSSYHGFQTFHDLFSVEAAPFTLLANFSASITARALSQNVVVKEFCIIVQQNQPLHIVFTPETSQSKYNYAFINGIEIISVPSTISYCHGGDTGVHVLGKKSVIYVDNSTALERVYHQTMKWGSVLGDIGGMFGTWTSNLKQDSKQVSNLSFQVSVDVGFRYLVRVHLCEVAHRLDFMLMIDNIVALTNVDMQLQQSENPLLWYNYMVLVQGKKRERKKHSISISLHSQHELVDRQGLLEGFEVLKLSNHDLSLASPNPLPDSPPKYFPTVLKSLLGHGNAIATVVFTIICLVNIIVHLLQKMWQTNLSEEENEPSAMPTQSCRRFSLAEILSATENFHSGFFIGKGGFGRVYKGFIDNGREIVAVKRLKLDSNQGEQQFWTEVEMLSKLRHVNLVSLLGFCVEQQEMILVYEFMSCGTLSDHLFKLAQQSHDYIPLSWKQRLKICIGVGRALDYLHTGHGIIHRDVKSSNILLDEKFVAKVSDFGLAKPGFGSESQSQHSTLVKGTHGYLDPHYCETHKPTKKSDTYSLGVVLLEVLCGRRAMERHCEEDKCRLATWAIDNISKGQVDHIVLPSLIGEISPDSLKTFVKVVKRCLHDEPRKRPAATRVVMKLELALWQQEKAESVDPYQRTSVEDLFTSTDKHHKENMRNNDQIDINCSLAQMENAISPAQNEIRNVTDAIARSDYAKTVTFLPSEQMNRTMINSGRKDGRKSMMLRISRKLWPWDAFWKTRKPSNRTGLIGPLVSGAESSNEKEDCTQTIRIMDNISKGEADHIVAPTLRAEISPDSLRTFVNIAEKWLHDEPKNRPTTMHIVTHIELSLQQQEKAELLPPKDITRVEGVSSSSTGTSQKKENTNIMEPNDEPVIANDASPYLAGPVLPQTNFKQQHTFGRGSKIVSNSTFSAASGRSDKGSLSLAGKMLPHPILSVFSFAELKAATRNFRSDSVLGEGGFGKVYKGWLGDRASNNLIAVKKLNSESLQGFEEWKSEVNFLGRLSHPNLVALLGYCWEDRELLLVYEFMPKGSLENHLFGRGASVQPLPWDMRLKILIGAARGLAFLHASDKKVIYRDFKASNILLDGSYNAKLSDFGLAKMGPTVSKSHVSTQVMGTYGYAAPEYIATGHLYVKSDVYGFGVVLVEMLTGLRALDKNRPSEQHNLVNWMKPYLSNRSKKLNKFIDPRLQGRYSSKSVLQLAHLAFNCLEAEPRYRPSMQETVETLEKIYGAIKRETYKG